MNEKERNSLNNPYEVTPEEKSGYPFTQADQTDEIDTLANDAGADAELEVIVSRKPNRHERRKQAKLARMLAMKEKLEAAQRSK